MQKEQLSALMDGETLDSELLNELAHNPEMQKTWESYHVPVTQCGVILPRCSISISLHA